MINQDYCSCYHINSYVGLGRTAQVIY